MSRTEWKLRHGRICKYCASEEISKSESRTLEEIIKIVLEEEYLGRNKFNCIKTAQEIDDYAGFALIGKGIDNLVPFKYLTHLTFLNLSNNRITDPSPLASLDEVRYIYLFVNLITSYKSLDNMKRIKIIKKDPVEQKRIRRTAKRKQKKSA